MLIVQLISCFTGMMRWMAVISTDQQHILKELNATKLEQ